LATAHRNLGADAGLRDPKRALEVMPKLRLIPRSTKTLHLLRHAKSSWKEPGLDDHQRPLSKRGRAAASAMAKHIHRAAIAPDIVLCSTAVRAKETLEPIAKKLKPAKVIFESGIYEVAERELWKYVRALREQADTVLMIGHNPGLHNFALALADADSVDHLPPLHGKFPSGALATFSFDGRWKDLRPHGAHLVSFVRPKELAAAKQQRESSPAKRRRGLG
jgi:phosphohistidine phosphatase